MLNVKGGKEGASLAPLAQPGAAALHAVEQ